MPANLFPTPIQQRIPHSNWINAIPFPQMRDNLIIWHDSFDHAEFLIDLIEGEACDVTVRWRGAIIWGQPYLMESWEFTAQFLRKWAWTVEGCEDAIRVSNSWRMSRGITPLRRRPHGART
ncbi:hypothetical protein CC79DRAFT_1311774 [Sarocladium strictum]